jgi:hypothetical protein
MNHPLRVTWSVWSRNRSAPNDQHDNEEDT